MPPAASRSTNRSSNRVRHPSKWRSPPSRNSAPASTQGLAPGHGSSPGTARTTSLATPTRASTGNGAHTSGASRCPRTSTLRSTARAWGADSTRRCSRACARRDSRMPTPEWRCRTTHRLQVGRVAKRQLVAQATLPDIRGRSATAAGALVLLRRDRDAVAGRLSDYQGSAAPV